MNNRPTRRCPICGGSPGGLRFPYRTRYDNVDFDYLGCRECATVFVDPVPAPSTFAKMYAKSAYHDVHYGNPDSSAYRKSAELLAKHVPAGSLVLDFGCGAGSFLAACSEQAFRPIGVDFDESAARSAGEFVGCAWASMADFEAGQPEALFDVIHLGDVLEHLPDPRQTISMLLKRLRPGGCLFIEGPLEVNPSPVYWSARLFGSLKRLLKPEHVASHPPTHLFRTDARSQKRFFNRFDGGLTVAEWVVEETGWPYRGIGKVKNAIASAAVALGGRRWLGLEFGNRFKGIFFVAREPAPKVEA